MATYFLMGMPFIGAVIAIDLFILKTRVITTKQCWAVMAAMLLITAVFDQFLTGLPIVHYNAAHMSGLRIWHAPVEDFMYTFAAVIGLGSLMRYDESKKT